MKIKLYYCISTVVQFADRCKEKYFTDKILILYLFKKYHLLDILLYFSVRGLFFTKKRTNPVRKRYSHSTSLIRKNHRNTPPITPHSTAKNQPKPNTKSYPT